MPGITYLYEIKQFTLKEETIYSIDFRHERMVANEILDLNAIRGSLNDDLHQRAIF